MGEEDFATVGKDDFRRSFENPSRSLCLPLWLLVLQQHWWAWFLFLVFTAVSFKLRPVLTSQFRWTTNVSGRTAVLSDWHGSELVLQKARSQLYTLVCMLSLCVPFFLQLTVVTEVIICKQPTWNIENFYYSSKLHFKEWIQTQCLMLNVSVSIIDGRHSSTLLLQLLSPAYRS